jgi:hypothetical protein
MIDELERIWKEATLFAGTDFVDGMAETEHSHGSWDVEYVVHLIAYRLECKKVPRNKK